MTTVMWYESDTTLLFRLIQEILAELRLLNKNHAKEHNHARQEELSQEEDCTEACGCS